MGQDQQSGQQDFIFIILADFDLTTQDLLFVDIQSDFTKLFEM